MTAKKKYVESNQTTYALSQIKVGKYNPRKVKTDIASLASDIKAHGLINPITVLQDGTIVAGHRRYAALKKIYGKNDVHVAVTVVDSAQADEIAISENTARENMHPADTFEAFKCLADTGDSITDIAAKFGYSELYVKQMLALAGVSGKVMAAYREGEIDLETVKAFTGGHDAKKQNDVLSRVLKNDWSVGSPEKIRDALNDGKIESDDRRVLLVGWDAFEKAGGVVHSDLFGGEKYGEGEEILNKLVEKKSEKEVKKYEGQGWKFVKFFYELPYEEKAKYGTIQPTMKPLPKKEQSKLEKLEAQIEKDGWDFDISQEIDAIKESAEYYYSDEDKARSGVLISIGYDGAFEVYEGKIAPEDVRAEKKAAKKAEKTVGKKEDISSEEKIADDQIVTVLVSTLQMARDTLKDIYYEKNSTSASDMEYLFKRIEVALEGAK